MALPKFNIKTTPRVTGLPAAGMLEYQYSAFRNLKIKNPTPETGDLGELKIDSKKAGLDITVPLEITIEESYDSSANVIVNDKLNPPKIVNSRFYLTGENGYEVADRRGNLDTNIYNEDTFTSEGSLIKTVQSVVKLEFMGISDGGILPVGNYTFFFKLGDADGNESDFISESGRVVCHIGGVNQPKFIRGGLLNENSKKSVKFNLKNIDLGYHYIHVYFTRSSGSDEDPLVTAYRLTDPIKVSGNNTQFNITGYEDREEISLSDINISYTQFDSAKSITNCQNISFAGNIENDYNLFSQLEQYSLLITPEVITSESVGYLNEVYREQVNTSTGYEYYNAKNIYYKLGLWDEEIYRYGIVYILNNYTLSPVFNIRGIKELYPGVSWGNLPSGIGGLKIDVDENNIINGTKGLQNNKGVFKLNYTGGDVIRKSGIKPIGIKFKFNSNVINSTGGLAELTKGFFFVRQRRIPTIIAQSVGIATTNQGNLPTVKLGADSNMIRTFLTETPTKKPRLGHGFVTLKDNQVTRNALLCPEASIRNTLYNSYFNSSEYILKPAKYGAKNEVFSKQSPTHYHVMPSDQKSNTSGSFPASLLLINSGTGLVRNGVYKYASKAGLAEAAHKSVDVIYGDYADPSSSIKDTTAFNNSTSKVRGEFTSYIGTSVGNITPGRIYNIFQEGYNFSKNWSDYFKLRISDNSAYTPVGDRLEWSDLSYTKLEGTEIATSSVHYRGDCYINTVTQRIQRNFIDPELPTNKTIVDPFTWYKNFRLINQATTVIEEEGKTSELTYHKLLPLFTYKGDKVIQNFANEEKDDIGDFTILDPESKHYKKYSEANGIFGFDKINRPDINAVGIGLWVTTKVCSNVNLAMRDTDPSNPSEEALHQTKRSFYPLEEQEILNKLPESTVINQGISKTSGDKYYFELGDTPFIKTKFPTRIHYSLPLQQSSFVNGNRVFLTKNYQDYTNEHGSITKLIEWRGSLVAVMEHGVLLIPVNERSMMANESGENVYINTDNVLPKNPRVLSSTFGSLWPESIIKTDRYIYGIDTVGKKIWRTDGESFENISDLKIQKFLNDNILLRENQKDNKVGHNYVKTHYNAFKHDIMFTFRYAQKKWNVCYNELLDKWITRYTWFPEFSENINNIFYTFADTRVHSEAKNYLYKHGFSGSYGERGVIKSAYWYDEQHKFEFEFVVSDTQGVQKIFDNLNIISNKVEPNSLIYEFIGDSYDWEEQKDDIWELSDLPDEFEIRDKTKGFGSPFNTPF